jgi:prepilin-type N-terminal cleavage/methylation domain-containing protein
MLKQKTIFSGFTLAEVLLTLLIIGVVSSLVIPSLLQDTQDQENKVAWKKMYGEIAAATQKIMLDNGGTMKGVLVNAHEASRDTYLNYLSGSHNCSSYATNCGSDFCNYFSSIKAFSDSYTPTTTMGNCSGSGGGFSILSNGTFFVITSSWNGGNNSTCDPFCARIVIDVNGFKGPNRWGRDIFGIFVIENAIKPYGYPAFGNEGTCTTYGYSCSLEYLYK